MWGHPGLTGRGKEAPSACLLSRGAAWARCSHEGGNQEAGLSLGPPIPGVPGNKTVRVLLVLAFDRAAQALLWSCSRPKANSPRVSPGLGVVLPFPGVRGLALRCHQPSLAGGLCPHPSLFLHLLDESKDACPGHLASGDSSHRSCHERGLSPPRGLTLREETTDLSLQQLDCKGSRPGQELCPGLGSANPWSLLRLRLAACPLLRANLSVPPLKFTPTTLLLPARKPATGCGHPCLCTCARSSSLKVCPRGSPAGL